MLPPKYLNLYFQIHQPRRIRKFRFFDIGSPTSYFDEGLNKAIIHRIAHNCYLPANKMLLSLIKKHPEIRITFSISGIALEQLLDDAPAVVESFRDLAATGAVEFLGETYYHSLAFLTDRDEFITQVVQHSQKMIQLIGVQPVNFRNTELIYSDALAETVYDLGFKGMYLEGLERSLGGASPNRLYKHPDNPLLLFPRNYVLCDDIAFRYSDRNWNQWPLTPNKYFNWLKNIAADQTFIGMGMDYETFGEHQKADAGIFNFMEQLISKVAESKMFKFVTPTEAGNVLTASEIEPTKSITSWADKQKDLSAWLGNELQRDAFESLKKLHTLIMDTRNSALIKDYRYLQASDHFYYMSTQKNDDGHVHQYFSPYDSPYEAFMNYMNVLTDLEWRGKHETDMLRMNPRPLSAIEDRKLKEESAVIN